MKTKAFPNFLAISLFIFTVGVCAHAEPPQQSFISVIDNLEKYLREQDISLAETEDIRDVATLGYLNALDRLRAPFGTLDTQIKKETKEWLKIWCWFPSIPEDKKKKVKKELTEVRSALAKAAYKRTLATLSVVPGLAVTSLGEIYSPKALMAMFPPFGKSEYVFGYAIMKPGFTSSDIAKGITNEEFMYSDIVNIEMVDKYLR